MFGAECLANLFDIHRCHIDGSQVNDKTDTVKFTKKTQCDALGE